MEIKERVQLDMFVKEDQHTKNLFFHSLLLLLEVLSFPLTMDQPIQDTQEMELLTLDVLQETSSLPHFLLLVFLVEKDIIALIQE